AVDDTSTVEAGRWVDIDVLKNDVGEGLRITSINGTAIAPGGAAVALIGGSIALLADGTLRFAPATGFSGGVAFDYTVVNSYGLLSTATVALDVKVNTAPTAVALENVAAILETDPTTNNVKVGDIVISDDGLGSNRITLSGADAGQFVVIGSELFLK